MSTTNPTYTEVLDALLERVQFLCRRAARILTADELAIFNSMVATFTMPPVAGNE
jgi:hypothetical protein